MRLNINLATQPYENARRFTAIWTGILGVLLLSAALLGVLVSKRWHDYRQVSRAIAVEKNVLQDLDEKQKQDLAILNKPDNRDVREKSEFLNQLILRKEISWTRIFINLEKMMPPHLRVLSVQPSVVQDQIILSMQLGGDSRDRAAELVRRMEKSKTFRNAHITVENDTLASPGQQDPMRFTVRAEYVPGVDEPETTPDSDKPAGGQ